MGFRFRRGIKLFPGVRLNFSGSGISTTFGVRGAGITVGPRGTFMHAGIPGTGLGLAVSRRIVEAHNGRIGFDALDGGTRFWIDLPLESAAHERPRTTAAA